MNLKEEIRFILDFHIPANNETKTDLIISKIEKRIDEREQQISVSLNSFEKRFYLLALDWMRKETLK